MNEIDILVAKLNELQGLVYKNFCLTPSEKAIWRETCAEIRKNGYLPKHRKNHTTHVCNWFAVKADSVVCRNSECPYIFTDVRPKDGYRTLKGDCTTRALFYVLGGSMTYRQIESEQYALAAKEQLKGHHVHRNSTSVWDLVILNRGWTKITVLGMKRSVIGRLLGGKIHSPIITRSSGHVAVVDENGAVRDIWDSRGGKVRTIYCKIEECENIRDILGDRVY